MPSDTRYVLTATARRSPSARLYSAVPRSSQCPSISTIHVGNFFNSSAFPATIARPWSSSSALSRPKNAGFNGELRFSSSSERLPIESSASGSAGTGSDSSIRSLGRGAGPGAAVTAGGVATGGAGRATGACRRAQPATTSPINIRTTNVDRVTLTISRPRSASSYQLPATTYQLVRPRRRAVVPVARDLLHDAAVTPDGEHLPASRPRGGKRQMLAVGGIGGALVGPLAERDLPRHAARQ